MKSINIVLDEVEVCGIDGLMRSSKNKESNYDCWQFAFWHAATRKWTILPGARTREGALEIANLLLQSMDAWFKTTINLKCDSLIYENGDKKVEIKGVLFPSNMDLTW